MDPRFGVGTFRPVQRPDGSVHRPKLVYNDDSRHQFSGGPAVAHLLRYRRPYPISPGIHFNPGLIHISPKAAEVFRRSGEDWRRYLDRHCHGDWGDYPYVRDRKLSDRNARKYMSGIRLTRDLLPETPARFLQALTGAA